MNITSTNDMIGALQEMSDLADKMAEISGRMFARSVLGDLAQALRVAVGNDSRIDRVVEDLDVRGKRVAEALEDIRQALANATDRTFDAKVIAARSHTTTPNVRFR